MKRGQNNLLHVADEKLFQEGLSKGANFVDAIVAIVAVIAVSLAYLVVDANDKYVDIQELQQSVDESVSK